MKRPWVVALLFGAAWYLLLGTAAWAQMSLGTYRTIGMMQGTGQTSNYAGEDRHNLQRGAYAGRQRSTQNRNGKIGMAQVHATGQTASYAEGDDGDWHMGAVYAGGQRFTDNGDGTVTDNLTGLIWMRDAEALGMMNWYDALDAAAHLQDGRYGLMDGSKAGDWRLPNVRELQSLIDFGAEHPAMPADHPFVGVMSRYWSSTSYASSPDLHAWPVRFDDGFMAYDHKSQDYYVWCVRRGK
ncbi:MAG: DUF1566 domain-containing protein [Deltaproteobacteria bacterium]|nr:DUF1566 domain-containing protein [Deltaproteobacteria bacterium]